MTEGSPVSIPQRPALTLDHTIPLRPPLLLLFPIISQVILRAVSATAN